MVETASSTTSTQLKDIVTAAYDLVDNPEIVSQVLLDCEINTEVLQHAPQSFTLLDEVIFVEMLSTRVNEPDFALKLGLKCPDTQSVPSFILRFSASLRAAIPLAVRYLALVDPTRRIKLVEDREYAKLVIEFTDPEILLRPSYQDFALAKLFAVVRGFLNDPDAIETIRLNQPSPSSGRPISHVLGAEVHASAGENAFVFRHSLLDKPNPEANVHLVEHLSRLAEAQLKEPPADQAHPVTTQVKAMISSRLPHIWSSEADVAARLHVSPRTLARQLANEGSSFRQVLWDIRMELAESLLAGNTRINRMHKDLGYSSPSAFATAFRRETGMTPSAFRKRIRGQHNAAPSDTAESSDQRTS